MRRRLALLAAATTSMVVLAFVVPLAVVLRSFAADRALTSATLEAQSLVSVLAAVPDDAARQRVVEEVAHRSADRVTVFRPDLTAMGDPDPADARVRSAAAGRVTSRTLGGGREVVAPVAGPDGQLLVVRVVVPAARARAGVTQAWILLALIAVALVAVSVGVADRLARSIVRPIRSLAATARRLEAGDLDARAPEAGPREVVEVGHALNRLAQRIVDLVAAERESLADLSHRLRTPLTALRLEAESIGDGADARRVGAAADKLAGAVDDLIAEARRPSSEPIEVSDLAAAVRQRASFWRALAEDQGRAFDVRAPIDELPVVAGHAELADTIDALLGNVFAHTPDTAPCAVDVRIQGSEAVMVVDDGGPGFDDGHVVQRGVSGAGSTGLGLDIARRVAERASGTLRLGGSPLGGARVEIRMPLVGAAPVTSQRRRRRRDRHDPPADRAPAGALAHP